MTQEELAEKLSVSRQAVSKWELDQTYPDMEKFLELCNLFSCSMDQLIREDMEMADEAFSEIRTEIVAPFSYVCYTVISCDPETDSINHVKQWANDLKISSPMIIGWDFPELSQEQVNVFHMHGYTAALILDDAVFVPQSYKVYRQEQQNYIAITIKEPFTAPFRLIPNAYKTLLTYMQINGYKRREEKNCIECFEKEYLINGIDYMDVYIAIE